MADRVKYFLLGLLFLVVAGVIAYDRWNSRDALPESEFAEHDRTNSGEVFIGPSRNAPGVDDATANGGRGSKPDEDSLIINPRPFDGGKDDDGKGANRIDPEPDPERAPDTIKPKPLAAGTERVYIVKSGDALEKISRHYYPDKVYKGVELIVSANGLSDANAISEGQELVIPAMDARATRRPTVDTSKHSKDKHSEDPAAPKADSKSGIPAVYVVKASDGDLYKICRRFYGSDGEGARVARIMEANNLWSVNVKPGARLNLPPR